MISLSILTSLLTSTFLGAWPSATPVKPMQSMQSTQPPANGAATIAAATTAAALMATDRAFASGARARTMREALGAMFDDGVMMPAPRGQMLAGRTAVLDALTATADSAARVTWTPIRVGLSADGLHGFTVGFMLTSRPNGGHGQYKYLAYWVRDGEGANTPWRVVAWRRRAIDSTVSIDSTVLPPLLPAQMQKPTRDAAVLAAHRRGLIEAEAGFSNEAQRIGVGAAFAALGTEESLNVGLLTEGRFTRGAAAIARVVSGGQPLDAPSTIVWGADTAFVASSGDLGITFGVIRPKAAPAAAGASAGAAPPGASFFTIWRRASPTAPWRYVAE